MKQTQSFIPTYTADVSGVCSALFELGGMTVMHDASGCNSTYNTHDEPRWYDQDSLVFISGLSEIEAIMGDDDKLINDIIQAVKELSPRFVSIAGTPIPMMTGCDLPGIAAAVEAETHIPCFCIETNGMHSYIKGASAALNVYARRMMDKTPLKVPRSVNILGATPLDFSVNGATDSMKAVLEQAGWTVLSTWAMGSSPEELARSGGASVNLVVSSVGLPLARYMKEAFGVPYTVGTPYGPKVTARILQDLEDAAASGHDVISFQSFVPREDSQFYILGEGVNARSLAFALHEEHGLEPHVICPLETENAILSKADRMIGEEEMIQDALSHAAGIIADPLYRPILPEDCQFYPLPHEAFSGRLFRKQIPNLIEKL